MEITKDMLYKLYEVEKKSTREIGLIIGKSQTATCRLIRKHGIKTRPFSTKGLQPRLGAVLSEETKYKMGKGRRGKRLTPEHRAKVIKTLVNGVKGELNPAWKGGKIFKDGYVKIMKKDHPRADTSGYVYEHILVMEKYLERYLHTGEVIHHLNSKKDDNRISNLVLFPSHSEHVQYERKTKFWNNKTSK